MTIKEIVEKYLKEHGFGGLFSPSCECACRNSDLFPCEGDYMSTDCEPGYEVPGNGDEVDGEEIDFYIRRAKSTKDTSEEERKGAPCEQYATPTPWRDSIVEKENTE